MSCHLKIRHFSLFMAINKRWRIRVGDAFSHFIDIFHRVESWGVKLFGPRWRRLYAYRDSDNRKLLRRHRKSRQPYWLVCGLTHQSMMSTRYRYVNLGDVMFGSGTYLEIDTDTEEVELKTVPFSYMNKDNSPEVITKL